MQGIPKKQESSKRPFRYAIDQLYHAYGKIVKASFSEASLSHRFHVGRHVRQAARRDP